MLSLLLCGAMIFSMVGCSDSDDNNSNINISDEDAKEPVTLTVYGELSSFQGEQGGWSGKLFLDKFNVILDIVPSFDGVYEAGVENGHLGDIIVWGSTGSNYVQAVNEGLLYDWNKDNLLKKHGSYIYKNMKKALESNQELTLDITGGESSALYGFGHNVATSWEDHESFFYTWDIRWDLYKELGYPTVNDLNDLFSVFKSMKEICTYDENGNETYAVSLWTDWDKEMVFYVKSLASAYYGCDELGMGLYDSDTGMFYGALEEAGPYLESLKFFNMLYQNNLVDPASKNQTYDDMNVKMQSNGVLWSLFNYSGNMIYNTDEHMSEGMCMLSLLPEQADEIVYGLNVKGGIRVWSIGANTEYPELCMDIINWLCTPEGTLTYLYGPKELCWDYDEEGNTYLTEFGEKAYNDRNIEMEGDYAGTGSFNDGCIQINNTTWSINASNPDSNGESYNIESWRSTQKAIEYEIEQDWYDYMGVVSQQEYFNNKNHTVIPSTSFICAEKDSDLQATWDSVGDIIVSYSWNAIYAENDEEFDEIVTEMIDKAQEAGYADCVKWCEEQAEIRYLYEENVR